MRCKDKMPYLREQAQCESAVHGNDSECKVVKVNGGNSRGMGDVDLHVVKAGMGDRAIGAQRDWK